jgi:hypothetical protein
MTHHEHPNVTLAREGLEAMQRGDMAWIDEHLADDVVWHVGGNSKWAGAYQGKAQVLDLFTRQGQAMGGMPSVEVHDGHCCVAPTLGTLKRRPRYWIRSSRPARRTRRPTAGPLAPLPPARSGRVERSGQTHAR